MFARIDERNTKGGNTDLNVFIYLANPIHAA